MLDKNQNPTIQTVEGSSDLSGVAPDDYVSVQGAHSKRAILFPAGEVLADDHTSIAEAKDGATRRLDGAYVTKLGGQVMGVSEVETDIK